MHHAGNALKIFLLTDSRHPVLAYLGEWLRLSQRRPRSSIEFLVGKRKTLRKQTTHAYRCKCKAHGIEVARPLVEAHPSGGMPVAKSKDRRQPGGGGRRSSREKTTLLTRPRRPSRVAPGVPHSPCRAFVQQQTTAEVRSSFEHFY